MDNQNPQQQPRRSAFSLLPFLLILAAIGGIIALIVNNTINRSETWSESALDRIVCKYGSDIGSSKTNNYYIKNATFKTNEKITVVNGVYFNTSANRTAAFNVTIDNTRFLYDYEVTNYQSVNDFEYLYHKDSSDKVTHNSYKKCFEAKIMGEYKKAYPTDQDVYYLTGDAFQVSWWDAWGPTIITTLIIIVITIFIFSRLNRSIGNTNSQALSFNQSRAKKVEKSKVKFADVAGCDEEKTEMQELVQYLKEPEKFSRLGAKLPKGVLLVGPPGTGKTLLAKAVAGEAQVPFFSISGSDFVEMFVGVGAGRVRDMFKKAKEAAPCLIFIDEIDAVGRQRGAGLGGGNDEREQTLNQLLVEMDGFSDNAGIIVIAATNRDDVLDPALLRAGRFDRKITVSLPDKAGREAIFKVHARNKKIDVSVNFSELAKRTVGFSGADIENIMNEAAILAVRENREVVTVKDIDEAIDRRIAGPAKSSKHMSDHERKAVAYHEAGHAIIGLTLPESDKVQKITIVPRGQTGGHVLMTPEDDRFLMTKRELIARIVGYLGGRSSEEIFFNDISTGAHNDIEVATRIARLMVTEYGMSSLGPIQYERDTGSVFLGRDYASSQKNFSTQIAYEIDKEVRKIIDEAHEAAKKIIEARKEDVILIAETLLEHETITAEEINALLVNTKFKDVKDILPNMVPQTIESKKPIEEKKEEVKEDNVNKVENPSEVEKKKPVKKQVKKPSSKPTGNSSKEDKKS